MGQNRVITTRVSPAAYKKLLQKCADGGCSTYEYFRQLVHTDVGLNAENVLVPGDEKPLVEPEEEPVQTELKVENEHESESNGIKITRG